MTQDDGRPTALLVDWGGVLTTDLPSAMTSWTSAEDLEAAHFTEVMRSWFGPEGEAEAKVNPVHALEQGHIEVPHFEVELAAALSQVAGKPVVSEGLLTRLFEHFRHAPDMAALVRRARGGGITTALLSNSWGDFYPMDLFEGMFDELVISGQVGMRKPDPQIFMYTAELVHTAPQQCVFVDDLAHNVEAASALGFHAVLHTSYTATADALSDLFGRELRR